MQAIHKMLKPASINAIVGRRRDCSTAGGSSPPRSKRKTASALIREPNYDEIQGVKSYPPVADLPEARVWWFVVPSGLDVLEACHAKGAASGHRHFCGVRRARRAGATRSADALGVFARDTDCA